ncbi:CYTH domain-containing protein [Taibaiella koreensis]|uniref:CYTH domain-containing protein n=1 Tax=Taibaiella koreensis TaxID=1268548 RepID=UPI000E59B4DC|nr:CYTH domain-containing protein [Taibaiella koreensis]
MAIEIERKFLVDADRWQALSKPQAAMLEQGYITTDPERTVRIRIAGETAWLTVKGLTNGASRTEIECGIPVATAGELLQAFALNSIRKRRYTIDHEDHTWEVDEFLGDNEGLIVAELELETEDALFTKPEWVTDEVTHDARYFNAVLARHPFKTWTIP